MSSEIYDVEVSYEEILAYFQSRSPSDERYSYKARILLEGIEQNRRGYQPEESEDMTHFVREYFVYASDRYHRLCMQKPKPRPAGSTWIMFYPDSVKKGITLAHQLTSGFVKVFFNGMAESFDILDEKYRGLLPDDAFLALSGKSVTISIEVQKIDPIKSSFLEVREAVENALEKLSVLEDVVSTHGGV